MTEVLRTMARAVVALYGRDPAKLAQAREQIESVRSAVSEDAAAADEILSAAEQSALSADLFPSASTH